MTTLNEIHRTNLVSTNGQPSKQLNIALKNKKNFSFIITNDDRFLYQSKKITVKELAIKYLNS